MRILLGWAWTYLIVAEVVGTMSGITFFINQQARYRNFDNVYAAIAMIGIIGLASDLFLGWLATIIFPWKRRRRSGSKNKTEPQIVPATASVSTIPSQAESAPEVANAEPQLNP
jgi:NitT/TauT family transport system permease protein